MQRAKAIEALLKLVSAVANVLFAVACPERRELLRRAGSGRRRCAGMWTSREVAIGHATSRLICKYKRIYCLYQSTSTLFANMLNQSAQRR
jgi:hypothetical protein